MSTAFTILAGTANPPLASAIAGELGVTVGTCAIDKFPDGEVAIQLNESVRRKEVFLVQPTSPPVNDHLVELLALADACRRAAAARVTAIIPYFGYGRADKRQGRSEPITGRVVADLLQSVGIAHVITVDLHTPQIEGFFAIPVDAPTAVPTLCHALRDRLPSDAVVVAPDVGRMQVATEYAQCLGLAVIILHKRRESGSETKVTRVIGDASDRACLIVDDMITTGDTVAQSIKALLGAGARPEFIVAATHGLFGAGARETLDRANVRDVFVTDTVSQSFGQGAATPPIGAERWEKLHVVSIAPVIAETLSGLLTGNSTDGASGTDTQPRKFRWRWGERVT
jgi:ribose-phosphate pyrophosphokinase